MIRTYQKISAASCSLIVPIRDERVDHLSAAELAKLQLPGLPRTKRSIHRLAERSGWASTERQRSGGLALHYAIADLPEEAQIELARRQQEPQPIRRRGRGRPAGTDWAERWPDAADAVEALYVERRLSAGVILDILRADPDGRFPDLPSVRTLNRFLRRVEEEQAALVASIRNPDRYKGRFRLALALADQLVAEAGYRAAKALTDPILGAVRSANSEEELRALLNAAPGDPDAMSQVIENAGVATRLDEEN